MSKQRNNLLLTVLFAADEDILSKELILFLDENVSREEAITPTTLDSVCMMFYAISPKIISREKELLIKENLTKALVFAWNHTSSYRERVAKLQRNRMRGYRISEAHKLRKIAAAFNIPMK